MRGSEGSDVASDGLRRRLITVAVDDYKDGDDEFVRGVKEQLRVLSAWWCDPGLGKRRFAARYSPTLDDRHAVETFVHDSGLREAAARDVVVLYITGHGVTTHSGCHFLLLPDSDPQRVLTTAYRTSELVTAALDSHAEHVLVIVNCCEAGGIDVELHALLKDITARRRNSASLCVLVTADFQEPVRVRELALLLERVHEQLRTTAGIAEPYLTEDEFLQELDRAAKLHRNAPLTSPMSLLPRRGASRPSPCLPNPGYQPSDHVVADALRQVAVDREEMDYWLARASGRTADTDGGWYFSGRYRLNHALARFLSSPVSGSLVVTGAAGSGKSAVIARAVTLSDPAVRADPRYAGAIADAPPETVPPQGSVSVAVLARQRESDEILTHMLEGLGQLPVPATAGQDRTEALREQLLNLLAAGDQPVTLVLDGLDEANSPYTVITQIITPLANAAETREAGVLRLVIGVRSSVETEGGRPADADSGLLQLLERALGDPTVLRTDDPGVVEDITLYVRMLLPPGSDDRADAFIARRTTPSFLDARLAAERFRVSGDPAALLTDPTWLDQGTVGLLRQDLADIDSPGLPAPVALALLRAAAFAQGAGIPWADVWPTVAEAVLGAPIPDADATISRLLDSRLAGYLARDVEDGRVVHRPAHDRLAEVLRTAPHRLQPQGGGS